jgi:hypothetical protein
VSRVTNRKNSPENPGRNVGVDVSSTLLNVGIFNALDLRRANCGLMGAKEEILKFEVNKK